MTRPLRCAERELKALIYRHFLGKLGWAGWAGETAGTLTSGEIFAMVPAMILRLRPLLFFVLLAAGTSGGQPFGLTNRVANTTLQLPATPPVLGYSATNALGTLTFTAPVAIVSAPGETNRLFIVEQIGRIVVITNLASPTRTVFMDISGRVTFNGEQGLLGLAFHPGYATNRYFYVFYVTTGARRDQLSRFEVSPTNANQGLPGSEQVLISQPDDYSNHNGGDLHFGSDGYLYVSLGDEGDSNDTGANSQRIDKDFFSGILRLDVDKNPGNLSPTPHPASSTNYHVPSDNPFVGRTSFNGLPLAGNVRTEFWAVGLRNPWRFTIDNPTGRILVGDVGQGAREEVDVIVKGGNYGWNYREGYIVRPGSGTPPAGFSAIPPILDYPRTPSGATNVGFSITGGVVYRGSRLPALNETYVFGDYGSGNIWAARYDGSVTTNVPFFRLLGDAGVAAFGLDPANGDVLYADVNAGVIQRILYNPVSGASLPPTLAQTGAFTNLATLTPHAGIIPYDVNVPYWSDGAIKRRWFSVPNAGNRISYRATNNWSFPISTIWIQHFDLELTNGVADSRRRVETRLLVRSTATYGLTYRWDETQTNATLVPEAGADETFVVNDGGLMRTQVWHYPGRAQCLNCHVPAVGSALGFNTPQLNRDFDYGGVTDNQLRALNNAGYFTTTAPATNLNALRALAPLTSDAHSAEYRARSYLTANCVQCHASGTFDARIFTPLSATRLIRGVLQDNLGDANNRVITPGSPPHSVLLTRLSLPGAIHMPPLDSNLIDEQAVALFRRWIANDLAGYQTFAEWQMDHFSSTNAPGALAAADPDGDLANNAEEYLTGSSPTNSASFWAIGIEREDDTAVISFPRLPNRGIEVQWSTDLGNPLSWQFLDVAANRPFIASTNGVTLIPDPTGAAPMKFYRARVYEP